MTNSLRVPAAQPEAPDGPSDVADVAPGLSVHTRALRARAGSLIGTQLQRLIAPSDLVQEAMVVAIRRQAALSGRSSRQVLAWLTRAMQFRLMHLVRDQKPELAMHRAALQNGEPENGETPMLSRLVRAEMRSELVSAMDQLRERERQLLIWIYRERLTTRAIAERMDLSEAGVRTLHHRVVTRLRGLFELGQEP